MIAQLLTDLLRSFNYQLILYIVETNAIKII